MTRRTRRCIGALAVSLLIVGAASAWAQTPSWLDRAMTGWNRAGAAIPGLPPGGDGFDTLARRCGASAARAESPTEAALVTAGWMPFLHLDRRIAREDVEIVGGMSASLPDCQPLVFNLFVFVAGRFAGTIAPSVMTRDRDGMAGAVRMAGADALTAEFARYLPADPECCPSSRVRVTYRIDRGGAGPTLAATDLRQIR
jgi:hypothetical protein